MYYKITKMQEKLTKFQTRKRERDEIILSMYKQKGPRTVVVEDISATVGLTPDGVRKIIQSYKKKGKKRANN